LSLSRHLLIIWLEVLAAGNLTFSKRDQVTALQGGEEKDGRRLTMSKTVIYTLLLALLTALPALPGMVTINSDLVNEDNSFGTNQFIAPHPVWISGGTDIYGNAYSWVSYAATGHYQLSPPNVADSIILPNPNPPTATFYEYFTLTHNAIGGKVTFWADDTARIYLESKAGAILLREANPIQDSACAAGPIACEPLEGFEYVVGALAPGDYRFRIEAYQRGSGPFGVMYTGAIMTDAPEPGTIALFGAGLAVVAWGASRRRRKY
jgi:hypothetical protein